MKQATTDVSAALLSDIEAHAASTDAEVCGFIYENRYVAIPNVANHSNRFYGDPGTVARVLNKHGEPEIIFHSHPSGNLELSEEDRRLWYYTNSTMMVGCMSGGRLRWKMYGKRSD